MPRYWLRRLTHVMQTTVLLNKAKFEWVLMKRQESVCWQLASLRGDPAWVPCHRSTAESVCVEARSWSDVGGSSRQTVKQRRALCVDWLLPRHTSHLILSLYLAMSHPLIDGLLVLPSDRKLAFVCHFGKWKRMLCCRMCTKELHLCVCVYVSLC